MHPMTRFGFSLRQSFDKFKGSVLLYTPSQFVFLTLSNIIFDILGTATFPRYRQKTKTPSFFARFVHFLLSGPNS